MAYNKSKAESKWRQWKKKEEEELRRLGMKEENIQKLRKGDWEEFKSDRRYLEHKDDYESMEENAEENTEGIYESYEVTNMQQMLDYVENEDLLKALLNADKLTLQIILLKIWGYSVQEIAEHIDATENKIYLKLHRLRKKLKKSERK